MQEWISKVFSSPEQRRACMEEQKVSEIAGCGPGEGGPGRGAAGCGPREGRQGGGWGMGEV